MRLDRKIMNELERTPEEAAVSRGAELSFPLDKLISLFWRRAEQAKRKPVASEAKLSHWLLYNIARVT